MGIDYSYKYNMRIRNTQIETNVNAYHITTDKTNILTSNKTSNEPNSNKTSNEPNSNKTSNETNIKQKNRTNETTNNMYFFINGCLKINKSNSADDSDDTYFSYQMRFLTEMKNKCLVEIILQDKHQNKITFEKHVHGLQVLKVNCTVFMECYNWEFNMIKKITYKVLIDGTHERECDGSFYLINPNCRDSLNFVFVADNKNKDENMNTLWHEIYIKKPHVIIHTGNSILGNDIFLNCYGYDKENHMHDHKKIYEKYAQLYRNIYSHYSRENSKNNTCMQAKAMRNTINIMIMGDNEIVRNIRNYDYTDSSFVPYFFCGLEAYINYQHQLHTDLSEHFVKIGEKQIIARDIDDYITGHKPIYYSLSYGKYKIILLDGYHESFYDNYFISDKQTDWLINEITQCDDDDNEITQCDDDNEITRCDDNNEITQCDDDNEITQCDDDNEITQCDDDNEITRCDDNNEITQCDDDKNIIVISPYPIDNFENSVKSFYYCKSKSKSKSKNIANTMKLCNAISKIKNKLCFISNSSSLHEGYMNEITFEHKQVQQMVIGYSSENNVIDNLINFLQRIQFIIGVGESSISSIKIGPKTVNSFENGFGYMIDDELNIEPILRPIQKNFCFDIFT